MDGSSHNRFPRYFLLDWLQRRFSSLSRPQTRVGSSFVNEVSLPLTTFFVVVLPMAPHKVVFWDTPPQQPNPTQPPTPRLESFSSPLLLGSKFPFFPMFLFPFTPQRSAPFYRSPPFRVTKQGRLSLSRLAFVCQFSPSNFPPLGRSQNFPPPEVNELE